METDTGRPLAKDIVKIIEAETTKVLVEKVASKYEGNNKCEQEIIKFIKCAEKHDNNLNKCIEEFKKLKHCFKE
ncbi:unnamed protein product [Aphis gossypii]|uniref:Uncharacterized protein n=1 Tax=Aphis gossypii TaxID=80765 RepID=A0A9P0IN51_APHGO|nr:unnamed protein product [Aphis gossypii]